MAADLAATPTSGIRVQACGDCHLSNFGDLRDPRAQPRLRPQRLRRDAAGAVRVGRQAPGGEHRRRRPLGRLHAKAVRGGCPRVRGVTTGRRCIDSRRWATSTSGTRASTSTPSARRSPASGRPSVWRRRSPRLERGRVSARSRS